VGLIILGLIIDLGGVPGVERIGFRYWKTPGPFVEYLSEGNLGRFLGFWSVLINAVFSFSGVESIAMAAAETRNPRKAIPKACKRVFARVTLFYILAVLIVGMLVASDDERLSDDTYSGTAAQSPFVIAASAAGIKAIPSIVNAVIITSAWSSSNQSLLAGTRVLYAWYFLEDKSMGCTVHVCGDVYGFHVFGIYEYEFGSVDSFLLVIGFSWVWGFDLLVGGIV
jgi:amino acid transporter